MCVVRRTVVHSIARIQLTVVSVVVAVAVVVTVVEVSLNLYEAEITGKWNGCHIFLFAKMHYLVLLKCVINEGPSM